MKEHRWEYGRKGRTRGSRAIARTIEVEILLLLPILSHRMFPLIPIEEKNMKQVFGKRYAEHKKCVRRRL